MPISIRIIRPFLASPLVTGSLLAAALALPAAVPASAPATVPAPASPEGFRYFDPADTAAAPKLLSQTGIYADINARKLIAAAQDYEVNAPGWSDDTRKLRWVLLKENTAIGFREKDDYWDYPDGAVFIEQFAVDTVPGETASRILWETRLLVNKKERSAYDSAAFSDRWYGFSYRWNKDQKDARLEGLAGEDAELRIWPLGLGKVSRMKKWRFPSRTMCGQCHRTEESGKMHGRAILGFFTAQLNRNSPVTPGLNQLDAFFAKGILKGPRPSDWQGSPRWRRMEDESASLDTRARSYIAANCSGCHGTRGLEVGATFGLDLNLDFHEMSPRMNFANRPVSWPFGLDSLAPRDLNAALLVSGFPQKSVILFRQTVRDTLAGNFDLDRNQMPPLGSFEVDTAATDSIRKWIAFYPTLSAFAGGGGQHGPASRPILHGRRLQLPAAMAARNPDLHPTLTGIDGRAVELTRLSADLYVVPLGLPAGLYVVKVGEARFRGYVF